MRSNPLVSQSSDRGNGGRAERPGLRLLTTAAALTTAVALVAGCGSSAQQPTAKINPDRIVKGVGTIPSWIPDPGGSAGHNVIAATMARPVTSASQGDTVRALYDGAVADVTAVGPYVHHWEVVDGAEGKFAAGAAVPVSYRVTLKDTKGTLPLLRQVFELVLPTGQALIPAVTPVGLKRMPIALHQGQDLTVKVAAKLPGGNGVIRWTPAGHKALVTWTYQLELD